MTSTSIFLLILFSAFLHALWNIIIKSLDNSLVGIAVKVFWYRIKSALSPSFKRNNSDEDI